MDLLKAFGTNKKMEQEGVWVDLGDGASIKVARLGNPESKKLSKRLTRPHKVAIRSENLPEEIQRKITIEVTAKTVLLDWKGIDVDGAPAAYTPEIGIRMFTEAPDFLDQVLLIANDMKNFQDEAAEAAAKN